MVREKSEVERRLLGLAGGVKGVLEEEEEEIEMEKGKAVGRLVRELMMFVAWVVDAAV